MVLVYFSGVIWLVMQLTIMVGPVSGFMPGTLMRGGTPVGVAIPMRMGAGVASPPMKPPTKKKLGGGGGGSYFVKELMDQERLSVTSKWKAWAKEDGRMKFKETINILDEMIPWKTGVIAQRKRRFTLACCKGSSIYAIACLEVGPSNESVQSFFSQDALMSLNLMAVNPVSPKVKAGTFLLKEIMEIGRTQNIGVDFEPIERIYNGVFYAETKRL